MSDEVQWLVEVSPGETRAALIDKDRRLLELRVERLGRSETVESIHLGRVVRVDKGMGAAFIDIGDSQPGFLGKTKSVTEGEKIIVQVVRTAGGGKGALVTASPVLAGRFLSLTPNRPGVHWPRDWRGDRSALAVVLERIVPDGMGLAPHQRAAGADEAALEVEVEGLSASWHDVLQLARTAKPPAQIRPAPDIGTRILREATGPVLFDHPQTYAALKDAAPRDLKDLLVLYKGHIPIFEEFGVGEQIEAGLARVVQLPGGASLVIETTEALTAIDVNMGGSGRRRPSETAIYETNRAAAHAAARQIRLRNLGGLIVVDFISMKNRGNRRAIVDAMRGAMRGDPVRHDVLGMTSAGLVEITRRRVGQPLAALYLRPQTTTPAPLAEAEACSALRAVMRATWTGKPVISAPPDVIATLQGPLAAALTEVHRKLGQDLVLRPETGRTGFEISSV